MENIKKLTIELYVTESEIKDPNKIIVTINGTPVVTESMLTTDINENHDDYEYCKELLFPDEY